MACPQFALFHLAVGQTMQACRFQIYVSHTTLQPSICFAVAGRHFCVLLQAT